MYARHLLLHERGVVQLLRLTGLSFCTSEPFCGTCPHTKLTTSPHALQAFAQTLQQSRGFGSEFRFSDQPASATTPAGQAAAAGATAGFANGAADDDDDLYS